MSRSSVPASRGVLSASLLPMSGLPFSGLGIRQTPAASEGLEVGRHRAPERGKRTLDAPASNAQICELRSGSDPDLRSSSLEASMLSRRRFVQASSLTL